MEFDLVFEGGGAKGMAFVGAMKEFEKRKHSYGRLLGTSAGAITAAFLAADYSVDEMQKALAETKDGKSVFTSFMGVPAGFSDADIQNSATLRLFENIDIPLIPGFVEKKLDRALASALMTNSKYVHLFSFIERGGWFSADNFVTWMKRKMNEGEFGGKQRNFGEVRLGEFYELTGRHLSLVAADTSGGRILVLNHNTAPRLPLVWAVRMSMSIPMVWPEVRWESDWGEYRDRNLDGRLIVDGGLLSNFPIELFVSRAKHVTAVMGEETSEHVLGMLIDEATQVPAAPPRPEISKFAVDLEGLQVVQRLQRLMDTVLGAHDKMVMEDLVDRVVRLPAGGYGTTEFDMDEARRAALVEAGRQAMSDYLDTFEARDEGEVSFGIDVGGATPKPVSAHTDTIASNLLDF